MKITIECRAKEIAELVMEIQERQFVPEDSERKHLVCQKELKTTGG